MMPSSLKPDPEPADGDPELEDDKVAGKPEKRSQPRRQPVESPVLRAITNAEDQSLREYLEGIGPDGSYRIKLARLEPEEFTDPVTGRRIKTAGHLRDYTTAIDEQDILKRHGGGKYALSIQRRDARGSFVYYKHRTIEVAGDPRTDDLPRAAPPPGAPTSAAAPSENSSLVQKAFGVLEGQLQARRDDERRDAAPRGIDPSVQIALDMMRSQMDASARAAERQAELSSKQIADLQRELRESKKPVEDPIRERMLGRLMDDDSARINQIRTQHESELRIVKENHVADMKRIEDRHERALDMQRRSYEREIDNLKTTNAIQIDAAKGAYETNMRLAGSENNKLERDNAELRVEIKDLRAKKEKGLLETMQEVEKMKEALGIDGGDDKSTADKIIEALPGAFEFAKGMIPQKAAAPVVATGNPAVDNAPRIVVAKGQKFHFNPATNQLVPVKKKKQQAPPVAEGLPTIDQEKVTTVVSYVERAFQANQDPEIFAQSSRSMVPDEILAAIRDHGVETFMAKVAKLPGTSPLATQAGKNWLRKVGTALVGE